MDKEDSILLKQAKENPEAYEALYKKYAQKIFNYFWYRVGHQKDVAEDLLQDTFMKAYKQLPTFSLRTHSYYSYLLTIAHNILVNYYRTPQELPLESIGDVPHEITIQQDLERKETAKLLWRAIQQLSEKERDIILLKYQKGLSIKEIANITKKSENAVKLILSRTRKKLAKHPYLSDMSRFIEHKKKYTKPVFLNKKHA